MIIFNSLSLCLFSYSPFLFLWVCMFYFSYDYAAVVVAWIRPASTDSSLSTPLRWVAVLRRRDLVRRGMALGKGWESSKDFCCSQCLSFCLLLVDQDVSSQVLLWCLLAAMLPVMGPWMHPQIHDSVITLGVVFYQSNRKTIKTQSNLFKGLPFIFIY